MPDMMQDMVENIIYDKDKFIDKEMYYESELFEEKKRTTYTGSDYLEYKSGKVNTAASNLKVQYVTGSGKSTKRQTQFLGVYFVNRFEKNNGDKKLIIKFDIKMSMLDRIKNIILVNILMYIPLAGLILYIVAGLKIDLIIPATILSVVLIFINYKDYKKELELYKIREMGERYGKEFNDLFLVEGSYDIADKILTDEIKNILIEFEEYSEVETNISIKNNIMYIAYNTGIELFRAGLFDNNEEKYSQDFELMKDIKKVNDYIVDKVSKILEEF